MQVVDGIAPYREFRVKGHTEDWFDGEIMERIKNCDKLNDVNFANYSEFDDVNNAFVDFFRQTNAGC